MKQSQSQIVSMPLWLQRLATDCSRDCLEEEQVDVPRPVERLWNVEAALPNFRKPTTWSDSTKVVDGLKLLLLIGLRVSAISV
jgi:uncharacterized membrane protein